VGSSVTIERAPRRTNWTVIDQTTLNDPRLSFRARGILAWILDKPDNWRTNADAIARVGKEGRDAVRAALQELQDAGYMERQKHRGENGRWYSTSHVSEVSPTNPLVATTTDFQASDNQASDFQASSLSRTNNKHRNGLYSVDSVARQPPPGHSCELCASGWMEQEDGTVVACPKAGIV
jgi:hypothetical protein